jgi:non-ribosomal peptide synthetase-like protein
MKVGPDSEISTIMGVVPELVSLEGSCFFADGIYLGGPKMQGGAFTIGRVDLSKGTFFGNHAVIPGGSALPADILLGICTVADTDKIKAGTSWFGHPSFELPRREIVECDRSLTHTPAWYRYLNRLAWEFGRFLLPTVPMLVLVAWFKCLELFVGQTTPLFFYSVIVPAYGLCFALILPALTVMLKWILLGRGKAGHHPLWSFWCCRWDFLYVTWGMWARPFAKRLEGTLAINAWLRFFGVGVGKRVFLGPGFAQVVDPDMLNFEDHATVANLFQAHSFEDRVLKKAPVYIREHATVRSGTVMLY